MTSWRSVKTFGRHCEMDRQSDRQKLLNLQKAFYLNPAKFTASCWSFKNNNFGSLNIVLGPINVLHPILDWDIYK